MWKTVHVTIKHFLLIVTLQNSFLLALLWLWTRNLTLQVTKNYYKLIPMKNWNVRNALRMFWICLDTTNRLNFYPFLKHFKHRVKGLQETDTTEVIKRLKNMVTYGTSYSLQVVFVTVVISGFFFLSSSSFNKNFKINTGSNKTLRWV